VQNYTKNLTYANILRKKLNLFKILAEKICYLHDCANGNSGELQSKAESEFTTKIWNMQIFSAKIVSESAIL